MAPSGTLIEQLLSDLAAEGQWLDDLVAAGTDAVWSRPTPSPGWTVAHQIAHLAWTDDQTTLAATDPTAFAALVRSLYAGEMTVDAAAASGAAEQPRVLLDRWRTGRARLAGTLLQVPEGARLPWFGPPMSATSMATARLMETWAHGQDVADALGVPHPAQARLRHVAHLAVRTRDFAFGARGLTPPSAPIAVRLCGPDGEVWSWGPDDASQWIQGDALDFCLVATQRRHRRDTGLVAVGADADRWLDIAQAFAGPPGPGRAPVSAGEGPR